MRRITEYSLDDGGVIWVESDSEEAETSEGLLPASGSDEVVRKAEETFGEALSTVRQVAVLIKEQITNLGGRPDEVSVEFGVKLTGSSNVIIASGSVEANLVLRLKWVIKDA